MKRQLYCFLLGIFLLSTYLLSPVEFGNVAQAAQNSILPVTIETLSSKPTDYEKQIKFEWKASQIDWIVKDEGMVPLMNEHALLNIPGKPIVPYKTIKYQLKPHEMVTYVKTKVLKSQSFPLFRLPFQLASEPKTIQDKKLSSTNLPLMSNLSNTVFPESNYTLIQTNISGGQGLTLFVYPVYISQNQWHISTRMTIEIGISKDPKFKISSLSNTDTPGNKAIILCPDELVSSANDLKIIQEMDGYQVRVVKISEMKPYELAKIPSMEQVQGFNDFNNDQKKRFLSYDLDLARRIRSFLLKQVEDKAISYLTILGDASYVPPSYYVFSNDGMGDYDQWVPTDYFYMAPDASGGTYSFQINVGRLPVRDAEEAKKVINKIRRYRKALDPSWFQNASVMGGDTFNGDYFAELAICRAINKDYFKGLNIKKYFKTEGLFTTDPVLQGFRENNKGFLWAFGHGSGDGLAVEPGFVHSKHLMDLPPADKLPIVVSEACGNGAWDSRLAKADFGTNAQHKYPTSFAEAVVLSEGAGIAYVGGARINYAGWNMRYEKGIPDLMEVYYMDAIVEYFFKQYSTEGGSLGDVVRRTMAEYIEEQWYWVNAPQIKTFFGFTLQGDPTIKLPRISDKPTNSYDVPEIDYIETMPLVSNRIPFFSIDDGINVSAESNSKNLNYIVSDYLDHETPLRFAGKLQSKSSQKFSHFFKPDKKSLMTIRVQTEDFKERRIVFYSRYNFDLVLYSNYDLSLLRKNERKDYAFSLSNEGIFSVTKIPVSIEAPSGPIKEYFIDHLPVMSSRRMTFSYSAEEAGEHKLSINAPKLEKETITTDNSLSYDLKVVDGSIARVGILQESRVNTPAYYEQRFMLKKLNQLYRDKDINVELAVVPFAPDNSYKTSMDRLNIDMMVLYTPYFYDYPMQEALSYLEEFEAKGGLTLGILNLGQNQYGFPLNEVQQFFGIDPDEKFTMKNTNDYKMKLQIKNDEEGLFSKDEYTMPSRFMLSSDKKWNEIALEDASLIALSEDEKVAMIRSGSRYLYSGFLSEKDFEAKDDALLFFMEMLSIPLKERVDVAIRSAHFNPLTAPSGEVTHLIVEYKNQGNVPLDGLALKVNNKDLYPLQAIQAGEYGSFSLPLTPPSQDAYQDYFIEIVLSDQKVDHNLKNNSKAMRYFFASDAKSLETPVISIEGALQRETLHDTELVQGKVTPGAKLKVNNHAVAVNVDGSFVLPLALQHGIQKFEFVAFHEKIESEKKIVEINRQKEVLIHLVIDDPVPYINFEPQHSLEAPPFIHNSLTYIPVRYIAEAFDVEVMYISETRTIQMKYQDITIEMKYLEMFATVTGPEGSKRIPLQGPYIIRLGRSFVPVRFIAEAFGAKVDWNAALQMVTITHRSSLGKVDALWSEYAQAQTEATVLHTDIVHGNNNGKLVNPSCIDVMDDGTLMISSYDGMYQWDLENEPKKIYDLQEWKGNFFDTFYFDLANSTANKTIFRQWNDKLVFTDQYDIYIIDPATNTMDRLISFVSFGTFLYPQRNYPVFYSMEIVDKYLYLLSPYNGINILDLETGEVVSQYNIPNYPFDFTIKNDEIMAFCLFGDLARLNITTGSLNLLEAPEMMIAGSISQNKDQYFLQTLMPPAIHEITLDHDHYTIEKSFELSSNPNILTEQIVYLDDTTVALVYDMTNGETALAKLNSEYYSEKDPLLESRKWKKENPSFNLFSSRTWLLEDDSVLISQRSPADTSTLTLYSSQGEKEKDIPVRIEGYSASLMDVQYTGNSTLAALIYNRGFEVQLINFDNIKKVRYSTSKLKPKTPDFEPYYWTVDDEHACIWDIISAQNVVFDLSSGEEIMRYDTSVLDVNPVYLSSNRMLRYAEDYLYILDLEKHLIRVFDPEGNFDRQIDVSGISMGLPLNITDFKVLDTNHFAFLDHHRSHVVFFKDLAIASIWGSKGVLDEKSQEDSTFLAPLSMDFQNDVLLINDAGHFRVSKINLGKERYLNPRLEATPTTFLSTIEYPLTWKTQMHIQRFDDDSPLQIEHPPELAYRELVNGTNSLHLEWYLKEENQTLSNEIKGNILLKTNKSSLSLPVSISRKPLDVKLFSCLVLRGNQVYHPALPINIQANFIQMDEKSMKELLNFDFKEFNGDLIVTMPKDLVIMRKGEAKAQLFDAAGSREIDLGAKVELVKGHYLIPIHELLKHLEIPFVVKTYGYKSNTAIISLPLDYEI
jgi:hypothetical protein